MKEEKHKKVKKVHSLCPEETLPGKTQFARKIDTKDFNKHVSKRTKDIAFIQEGH